jgi:tetratricopeptide (TPR) repeat protein
MAIKGSLREAGLADVCQLLSIGRKTGCLSVTDRSRFGQIYFDGGRVTFATIVNRRDRLGDMLVRSGALTDEQLRSAVDAQAEQPDQRLGRILLDRGLIDRETLDRTLEKQIEEAVYYLFTWERGSFFFEPDKRPDPGELLISVNPESLLLEGARRVDEWGLIRQKIPSMDLVFSVDRDRVGRATGELTPRQRALIDRVDGSRTVDELADAAGLGEFETGKALFGLIQAGLVYRTGRREGRREGAAPDVDEARNLGVAFFRTAMLEDAERAFRHVLHAEPDDLEARHYLALIALRRGELDDAVHDLSALLDDAPRIGVRLNLAYALRRQGRFDRATEVLARARTLAPDDPRVLLADGATRLFAGEFGPAMAALDAYRRRLDPDRRPPAPYYYCAALAAAVLDRSDEAEALLEKGLDAHPASSPLQLLRGNVAEQRGRAELAERYYRQATEGDGGLAQAHRSLGDLLARRGARREALEHYERAAELAPDLGDGLYTRLADLHYGEGQRQEAVRCWKRAVELNPGNVAARNHLELVARAER